MPRGGDIISEAIAFDKSPGFFVDDEPTLKRSSFNLSNPTKVFIHGWNMNGHSDEAVLSLRNGMVNSCCDTETDF